MKILYVTTIGVTMDFFPPLITELIRDGHIVDIATNECNGEAKVNQVYKDLGCTIFPISCSRSPSSTGNVKAIKEIKQIVENNHYDIVHCHTPIAAACTRIACKPLRKNGLKVFYTAHGFHFYTGAPLKNWLLYYPVEWICSFWTDVLITINQEDYKRAKEKLHAKRTEYVLGVGIDLTKFKSGLIDQAAKRKELGLTEKEKMIFSVGELSSRKNHKVVIEALAQIGDPTIRYYIAGTGPLKKELEDYARKNNISLNLMGYRSDVSELLQASDLFMLPSLQEGLPVALMEAIACKVPVVCSRIRGNTDLVTTPGSLFDPSDATEAAQKIENALAQKPWGAIEQNYVALLKYDLNKVEAQMVDIYKTGGCCIG